MKNHYIKAFSLTLAAVIALNMTACGKAGDDKTSNTQDENSSVAETAQEDSAVSEGKDDADKDNADAQADADSQSEDVADAQNEADTNSQEETNAESENNSDDSLSTLDSAKNDAGTDAISIAAYEEVYAPVLDAYRDILKNGYDYEGPLSDYIAMGMLEDVNYVEKDIMNDTVGYLIKDLSGDGVPELVVGRNRQKDFIGPGNEGIVYCCYTCKDNKPVLVFDGFNRSCYYWAGDGKFSYLGSGGIMYQYFGLCHLSDDGTKEVWEDFYFSEDNHDGTASYYHNTLGTDDVEKSEKLDITDMDFSNEEDSLVKEELPLTLFKDSGDGVEADSGEPTKVFKNNMSAAELRVIEKKLNSIGYYGFLLRSFTDPHYIDWNEVFYTGAGFDQHGATKEVRDAFLKATGDDEIYTDLTVVSGKDVRDYVKKTTGFDYDEMVNDLDWVYLEKYDLFISEHGDTNMAFVTVNEGMLEDGEYTIIYTNYEGKEYGVTFTEENGTYCFKSNLPDYIAKNPSYEPDIDQSTITEGQLIPDSDQRYLTEDDLKGFSEEELRIARNEIYARWGRKFKDKKLQEYFETMEWYFPMTEPDDFDESLLNVYEKENLDFISKYEKKMKK
ncbi:YARHG domain-containing protein [Butyrivibrio sp. WCD2001]|uniref:YARHG domain-containing protein n=1 Tax=Butyrivibrio sp. WCD2001 TaxID=1280681 RepID=UPI000411C11C|nr:YARHG domain-containing protein [Butyrivibrio sp. WCD2001]